ncbi:MAG: SMC-Scp complex subunit ScpB [Candidatus Zixiibacteriota bacterium]
MKEENINCTIEALILASPEPLSVRKIGEVLTDVSPARIRQGIQDLNNVYMGCGCSFRIREIAGGYQVHLLPDFEQPIKTLLTKQRNVRLTRAALETLAIIAYKQPVTKTDIEHIRGVASDGVIHNLMEHKLILIAGRADTPGRPLLYKTSQEFLKFFGLNRLSDLPRMDEIEEMIKQAEPSKQQTVLEFGDKAEDVSDEDDDDIESDAILETDDEHMRVKTVLPENSTEDSDDDADFDEELEDDFDGEDKIAGEKPRTGLREMVAASNIFGTALTEIGETDIADESEEEDFDDDDFDDEDYNDPDDIEESESEPAEESYGSSGFRLPEARFETGWDKESEAEELSSEEDGMAIDDDDIDTIEEDIDEDAEILAEEEADDFAASSLDSDDPRL